MSNVVAIVLAVISIAGTILTATLTAWFGYISDERKRKRESAVLLAKYRDPLLLAAQDLQSRLHNVTDWTITQYLTVGGREKENLFLYSAYVVGAYLSWVYILRRQLQFLRFDTRQANKELAFALANVVEEFSNTNGGAAFMLWRGDQMAIGEIMTITDGGEQFPMGYSSFRKKWLEDIKAGSSDKTPRSDSGAQPQPPSTTVGEVDVCDKGEFRIWFRSIISGVKDISLAKATKDTPAPDQRLRRLQHLIVDLINILDPDGLRSEADRVTLSRAADSCPCSSCKRAGPADV